MQINYKSDFSFALDICDMLGKGAGLPTYDWQAELFTVSPARAFIASSRAGRLTNCRLAEGRVVVVADNHSLGCGLLKIRLTAWLPNANYPDGTEAIVGVYPTAIELVPGATDYGDDADVTALMPYIKGEPFTFDDFTTEQLSAMMQPVEEAAVAAAKVAGAEAAVSDLQDVHGDIDGLRGDITTDREHIQACEDDIREHGVAIAAAARQVFNDRWVQRGGTIVDDMHYGLNGLNDITYQQAIDIDAWIPIGALGTAIKNSTIRTNFIDRISWSSNSSSQNPFIGYAKLEVANMNTGEAYTYVNDNGRQIFRDCKVLRKVIGILMISITIEPSMPFYQCYELREVKILTSSNLSFRYSPYLDYASVKYIIEQKIDKTKGNTLTFHPDVYAKLTGDTTNAAAAALTPQELAQWTALTATAATNMITLATV